jgi:glyoxalase/bleomycin resistance protein/dioxygenase superfamily protein
MGAWMANHWCFDGAGSPMCTFRPRILRGPVRIASKPPAEDVDVLEDTLDKVTAHGGEIVKAPYPEGDLWVATFRDPAGNEFGAWQLGPRRGA